MRAAAQRPLSLAVGCSLEVIKSSHKQRETPLGDPHLALRVLLSLRERIEVGASRMHFGFEPAEIVPINPASLKFMRWLLVQCNN